MESEYRGLAVVVSEIACIQSSTHRVMSFSYNTTTSMV